MQDKSFLQALQDLQDKVSTHVQEAMLYMFLHRTTAANATSQISDEGLRAIVTDELITDQLLAFLLLMKDLHLLDETQYDEFATYLLRSLASRQRELTTRPNP